MEMWKQPEIRLDTGGHGSVNHQAVQGGSLKATDRNRTGNLQITNQVLCQLSYGGVVRKRTSFDARPQPLGASQRAPELLQFSVCLSQVAAERKRESLLTPGIREGEITSERRNEMS